MIRYVTANKASFRSVEFKKGLNVVVADRTQESTKKDSRNGLGKSTLIEIIHFALGSDVRPLAALSGWVFEVGLTIDGVDVVVERAVDESGHVLLRGTDLSSWRLPSPPMRDLFETEADEFDRRKLAQTEWNELLGARMFGLRPRREMRAYAPTYRSLIGYIARRGKDAYSKPFEHYRKQKTWDWQVNTAYLLGLAWEDAADVEVLREKEAGLKSLQKAVASGVVEGIGGSRGELEAERVRLEEQVRAREESLATFQVHPQYREIEQNASALTRDIHELNNTNIRDRELLQYYEHSLRADDEPAPDEVARVYQEVGIHLPDLVQRRFEDVRTFHEQLLANRRRFLQAEIGRIRDAVAGREQNIARLSDQRANLMGILGQHGALDEYTALQQAHADNVAKLRDVQDRLANIKKVEAGRSQIKIEREQLYERARDDYDEREPARRRAISLFNAHSEALYQQPGRLVIEVRETGFKFDVEIERAKSAGIGNMKIFCYDLTVAQIWAEKASRPGFLIHDSLIFDGVDERQIAGALVRAADVASAGGFQYICTINSDAVPFAELPSDFDFENSVRLRLTDASPEGSLLGVRF